MTGARIARHHNVRVCLLQLQGWGSVSIPRGARQTFKDIKEDILLYFICLYNEFL